MEQQNQQPNQQMNQSSIDEQKRQKSKRIKIALLTLAAVLTVVGGILLFASLNKPFGINPIVSAQCPQLEQEIDTLIKQANYCEIDSDCVASQEVTNPVCGCPNLINANIDASQILEKKQEWQGKSCGKDRPACLPCPLPPNRATCQENRCAWKMDDSTIDMSDWQTYRNEEFGFEVKYPREYQVRKGGVHGEAQFITKNPDSLYDFVVMSVIPIKSSVGAEEVLKNRLGLEELKEFKITDEQTKRGFDWLQKVTIGSDIPGYMIRRYDDAQNPIYEYHFGKEGIRIEVGVEASFRGFIYNQILSTFRFVE